MFKENERGQNSIDLLLGVGVFFAGTAIIFATSTSFFFPPLDQVDKTSEKQSIADRIEDNLLGEIGEDTISPREIDTTLAVIDDRTGSNPSDQRIWELLGNITGDQGEDIAIEITATETRTEENTTNALSDQLYTNNTGVDFSSTNTIKIPSTAPAPPDYRVTTITRYTYLGTTHVKVDITIGDEL